MQSSSYLLQNWERLVSVRITAWLQLLQSKHRRILQHLLEHPTAFILWPTTILFVLSYPTLYSLYASTSSVFPTSLSDTSYVKTVDIHLADSPLVEPDFYMKSVWIQPNLNCENSTLSGAMEAAAKRKSHRALNKDFLLDVLHLQQELLHDLESGHIYIHSPFEYWHNNETLLRSDPNVLKTIHLMESQKANWKVPLSQFRLLSGISKVDGIVKSADSLQLCIIYPTQLSRRFEQIWEANLQAARLNDKFQIFEAKNAGKTNFELTYKRCNILERALVAAAPVLVAVYAMIFLTNIHSIKSRTGLFCAYIVQVTLSILSSATLSTYFCRTLDLSQLPLLVTLSIMLLVSIENTFRLLVATSRTSDEISVSTRICKSALSSHPLSTTVVLADIALLVLASPFLSELARKHVLFTSLALLFDHLMHITYFTTIVGIDVRRLELQDLLQRSNRHDASQDQEMQMRPLGSGSIFSSALLGPQNNRTHGLSLWTTARQYLFKVKLPLFKSLRSSVAVVLVVFLLISKWTCGVNCRIPLTFTSLQSAVNSSVEALQSMSLEFFPDKKVLAAELLQLYSRNANTQKKQFIVSVLDPTVVLSKDAAQPFAEPLLIGSDQGIVFNFDMLYILEFLSCLTFVVSSAPLILRYFLAKDGIDVSSGLGGTLETAPENQHTTFNSKELVNGHFLDVVRISTSSCPFIVSVGMDHKILVWSPMTVPLPPPTQLPLSGTLLPVTNVVMSNTGSLITVFSKSGAVKCWSRFTMSWIWTCQVDELTNDTPLESFFRARTTPLLSRSKAKTATAKSKQVKQVRMDESPAKVRGRTTINSAFLGHGRSPSVDSTFDRGKHCGFNVNKNEDFVMVLKNGDMVTVNCADGSTTRTNLTHHKLICCKKIATPRVNDRVVGVLDDGSLVVATAINNKWKVRSVKVQTESYNSGKRLITPAMISRTSSMNQKSLESLQKLRANVAIGSQSAIEIEPLPDAPEKDYSGAVIEPVPFVGMFVRACDLTAELIDVNSGTMLKSVNIGQFKPNTFKVFHAEPSHCRFCGCASVSSFSIAYTELETDTLIVHTFSIDNKAKNSICMRVERDPRETRCLGFASVTEHQHWLSNVEGWCPTDLNLLIGVRRKSNPEDETREVFGYSSNSRLIEGERLRSRKSRRATPEKKIQDIWEGWTMTAAGEVKYYDIPSGASSGLLIRRIGPVQKFGHKSIVVSFGNIMKILYLGNDNLIDNGETEGELSVPSAQPPNALGFMNRRRRMKLMKYELTHSTNFSDVDEE
ncbi:hypothetical protein KL949_001866 [Ogataea haglerorum]|nr:hypothetical protein KL913_001508 [Ogataea haglerorum]KAG7720994.1 hypothetical protein KL949_001866 [Ogataea haglerorum]KAG7770554.1 hypothetical protein KL931_001376 [Ogataea haglerorum]KAG7814856.1 hypothetical protein KL924_001270 [Ogataea haglerorum]